MKRKKIKKLGKAKCPCCKNLVGSMEYQKIENVYNKFIIDKGEPSISLYNLLRYKQWACDSCLQKKDAILANPNIQDYYGYSLPYFMYFDKEKTCKQCSKDFVFNKEEQKFWYEDLKFVVFAEAINCASCRKDKRTKIANNNRIMQLTAKADKSTEEIKELAHLYEEIGSVQKANTFLNQLEKKIKLEKIKKENKTD